MDRLTRLKNWTTTPTVSFTLIGCCTNEWSKNNKKENSSDSYSSYNERECHKVFSGTFNFIKIFDMYRGWVSWPLYNGRSSLSYIHKLFTINLLKQLMHPLFVCISVYDVFSVCSFWAPYINHFIYLSPKP